MKVGPCQYSQMREAAQIHGVTKLRDCKKPESMEPFRLVYEPACLPRQTYEKLKYVSSLWQNVTHKASMNSDFVFETFKDCNSDPLIGPLLQIYREVRERQKQLPKPKIDMCRYDYFVESGTKEIKLIEYNCHSVSMAGISSRFQTVSKEFYQNQKNLQPNEANILFARGVRKFYDKNNLDGVFLLVCQPNQTNVNDQKYTLEAISAQGIAIQRVLLPQLQSQCHLDDKGDLYFHTKKISVVYFRAGYAVHEHNDIVWKGKKKIYLSNAVSIPSVESELINTKRMQAQLSKPKIYQQFLPEQDHKTFDETIIPTWDFDGSQNPNNFIDMMIKEGKENFVLKPNQEGGSNNYFGEEAFQKFKLLTKDERPNYILAKKIYPQTSMCTFICPEGSTCCCNGTHEISIYGYIISTEEKEILENDCEGFLIRTKPEDTNECGLLMGGGAISALQLQ